MFQNFHILVSILKENSIIQIDNGVNVQHENYSHYFKEFIKNKTIDDCSCHNRLNRLISNEIGFCIEVFYFTVLIPLYFVFKLKAFNHCYTSRNVICMQSIKKVL